MTGPTSADADRRVLSEVLQRVPLPMIVAEGESGAIIDANTAFLDMFGLEWAHVVGQTTSTLDLYLDVEDRARLREEIGETGRLVNRRITLKAHGRRRHVLLCASPFDIEGRRFLLVTLTDTTEEQAARAKLEESETRFRGAFDGAATGMVLAHPDGHFLRVNRAMCRMLGYEEEALLTAPYHALTHPDDVASDIEQAERMLAGEIDHYTLEKRYLHRDGRDVWVDLSVSLVKDDAGAPLYFVAQVLDITGRKATEAALRASEEHVQVELAARLESERRYRAIFDHTFHFTGLLTPDGAVLEANRTALMFSGLSRDQVLGKHVWEAKWWAPETVPRIRDAVFRTARGENVRFEVEVTGAKGTTATVDFSLRPVRDHEGRVVMLIPEGHDVTELKRTGRRLESSLEEKEILLKEIHHRVKNNMQVVSSLLQLQSRYTDDPAALAMFRESQDRIRSMALIHEKLYKTKDLARVDFADYLHTLGEMMSRSYGGMRAGIRIDIDASPAWLGVDTAIPTGLILNELVTNAMKHAFDESSVGLVSIRFRDESGGRFTLEVEDDGVGLPPTFSLEADTSLGLRLLRILTGQIEGDLVFTTQARGTRFRLAFTDKAVASR